MAEKISVGLVGAGSMGGALLRAWLREGAIDPSRSAVFDPALSKDFTALANEHGIAVNPSPDAVTVDALVLAVKPQLANDVLPVFTTAAKDAVVISIMAGKSIAAIEKALGQPLCIARAMPNLPASISEGASGLYATDAIDADGRAIIERLLAASGETVWVETEQAIDFVTAVSGSGPAYYFLLTEALAEAGVDLGLPVDVANRLARATAIGAGALMGSDERDATALRKAVTSPGGTTAAALDVFNGDDKALRVLVKKAVAAAAKRASELTS